MTLQFKTEYLAQIRQRYFNSSKKQKSIILDELCSVTGFHRKYAIKILSKGHMNTPKSSGRTKVYSDTSIFHLKRLWHLMGRMCSKKMVAAFPVWLNYYQGKGFGPYVKNELLLMSPATVDRYLRSYKAQFARRKRTGTIRGSKNFQNIIPLKIFEEKESVPGFIECDTVAHCGTSLSGKFAWSITVTDIYSGWTNNRAIFGKGADETLSGIIKIMQLTPYSIRSFNVDNGTEFLNRYFVEYFNGMKGVNLTRSRAYRKNDNCHVEQKNFTHVRETFGYERIDEENLIKYMNEIYQDYLNPLLNFFTPQLKLVEKYRVGSSYKRKYDKPKTPYHRLMESSALSQKQKYDLEREYMKYNPILLKKELGRKISHLNKYLKNKVRVSVVENNKNAHS
ncbi:integrase [Halobacteriovorax sp. HLS]|uniref:integrase n=1 Tax=Halobacteriovorax sp. HLS TaxID=2234000 RepID=UPI000FD93755|nr:integrase [Halobacteriovorax sp. HLS]